MIDKTGTLTLGCPVLTNFIVKGIADDEALALIASVEQLSEHPIGLAIVENAKARGLILRPAKSFDAINGLGVQADIDGEYVLVGNHSFLAQHGVDTQPWHHQAEALRTEAKTVVFFAVDGIPVGIAAVADPIKENTPETIVTLKHLGIRIVMLTGDSQHTANAIARHLGIDEVLAEVLPEDKAGHVKRLQAEGRKVAMAGDGINDAPALAQADVGIAMGTGTDVVQWKAQVSRLLRGICTVLGALSCCRMPPCVTFTKTLLLHSAITPLELRLLPVCCTRLLAFYFHPCLRVPPWH